MARPHIEFIAAAEVAPTSIPDGPFAGSALRVLSADTAAGAFTALGELHAGWSDDLAGSRPVELFVLRGAATLDGRALGPGTYAHVPAGAAAAVLTATEATELLVMVEPERPAEEDTTITVVDQQRLDWHGAGANPDRAQGIVIKLLHEDASTGDWSWVAAVVPGWRSVRAEIHPTVEEAFMLRGDILLGDRGTMYAGTYFWRPPEVEHGPMYSRDGALFFFRTKGGPLSTTYVDVPGAEEQLARYAEGTPFYAGPAA